MKGIFEIVVKQIESQTDIEHGQAVVTGLFMVLIVYLVVIALCLLGWYVTQRILRYVFKKLKEKQGNKLLLQFLETISATIVTVFFVLIPLNTDEIRRTLLGSAALLTAVVGFAAQDVIKDILAGLQIAFYHPAPVNQETGPSLFHQYKCRPLDGTPAGFCRIRQIPFFYTVRSRVRCLHRRRARSARSPSLLLFRRHAQ